MRITILGEQPTRGDEAHFRQILGLIKPSQVAWRDGAHLCQVLAPPAGSPHSWPLWEYEKAWLVRAGYQDGMEGAGVCLLF